MAEHFTCAICLDFCSEDPANDYFVSTKGGHIFHYLCIQEYIDRGDTTCPICREPIHQNLTRLYGIKLKKTAVTLRLQSDSTDGTLPSMKIVVLGNSCVGKSSLLRRFSNQRFLTDLGPTCGCDVVFKNIAVGGKVFRLNLWDTAGQENFRSVVSNTVRGAHGILFVYDITSSITLSDLDGWLNFANKYCPDDCVKMIVGNKSDLTTERKISTFVGEAVAEKLKLPFCETSAKDGSNVEAVFRTLVARILEAPYLAKSETNVVELEVGSAPEHKKCSC
jgi:Ras-related protein Rab-1A